MKRYSVQPVALSLLFAFSVGASASGLSEDFEAYAAGPFPSPPGLDASVPFPQPAPWVNPHEPSATVVTTTNAFGAPTRALQTPDALGLAWGIYAAVPVASSDSVSADISSLRFANFNISVQPVPEPETWALMAAGLAALGWARRRQRRR